MTSSQAIAVTMLLAAAIPAGIEAANAAKRAEMGAQGVQELNKLNKLMEPLLARLRPVFEDLARNSGNIATALKNVKPWIMNHFDDPAQAEQIFQAVNYLRRYATGATSATIQAIRGPDDALDYLRLVTAITGIVDPTPVSGIISAFAYPVYVPPPPPPPSLAATVVTTWGNVYVVSGQALLYYRLNAGGGFGPAGQQISTGWGGMRFVTAGNQGELFALDGQGDLYFYRHDANLQWQVAGKKVGFGFGGMRTIFAGSNVGDHRTLYAVSNDGVLYYYSFPPKSDGSLETPYGRPIGWGWEGCNRAFGGTGGVVYCINVNGDLYRYAFNPQNLTATPKGVHVGTSWNAFTRVFAGPSGQIYAVQPDGALLAYRDRVGEVLGPVRIGEGWNFQQTTAMKQ